MRYTETFKYYFDVIMKPFSRFMLRAIEKIKPLEIDFICPGMAQYIIRILKRQLILSEKYAHEYMKIIFG